MLSYTSMRNLFGTLSQNSSSANLTMFDQLANIEHRYLLQKYFSNETSYSITTVGEQDLTLTGSLIVGATTATLSAAWTGPTTNANVTFSSGEYRQVNFIAGGTAISWTAALTETATTAITVGGLQFYPLPPNYSLLKTVTVTIGNLKWTLNEVKSRADWDRLNVFPYYADIPNNYFIYPGGDRNAQLGIWPIPSTSGNIITFNYKFRVPDLSIADYITPGTIAVANAATAVVGTSTTFQVTTNQPNESRWIQFAPNATAANSGDNLWYQIASIDSTTGLTLYQPYQGTSITASPVTTGYTIGQMSLLPEDFQDMIVWKVLTYYFSSITDNKAKKEEYEDKYKEKLELLAEYSGSTSVNVNLSRTRQGRNPNLFPYSLQG